MASAQAFTDAYITARAASDRSLEKSDLFTLHRTLMENMLHGYDVLPTAVHLTASTLALLAPEVAFVKMNLYVMPLGIDNGIPRLGSLDFLTSSKIQTQMALDHSHVETVRVGAALSTTTNAKVPKIDLCVMNPPFVRSVNSNLLFGSLPDERGRMQAELKRRVKTIGASATAGLGSVFIALADRHLERGGRMAFVLPATLATGEAWTPSRKLIADRYHLETVVSSHDAERPNFSENTHLSEILFIARKLKSGEKAGNTTYINLWRNPRTIYEAMSLANRITTKLEAAHANDGAVIAIRDLGGKAGEIISLSHPEGEENWIGTAFAQTQLLSIFAWLYKHKLLKIPGMSKEHPIPLCSLAALGDIGYDARDIYDAFEANLERDEWSPYPAFWNHDANKVVCLKQQPNANLIARTTALPGRKLKSADAVWSKAGDILIVSRLRTNTQKVLAVGFDAQLIGNTWWSFHAPSLSTSQKKVVLLWLNSTLGMLFYYSRRAITQGAWMQMKKPAWLSMPMLDVRVLKPEQLKMLTATYDRLCHEPLAPLSHLDSDPTRRQIDEALCKALDLPDLTPIRQLLAREPGLTAEEINPQMTQAGLEFGQDDEA